MHRTRNSKRGLIALMMIMALVICAACARGRTVPYNSYTNNNGTASRVAGTRVIEGYIVGYDRNNITVDEVEFLTADNTTRLNELGLDSARDFSNGYYVHNDGNRDRMTLPLASNVRVRFVETAANLATDTLRDGAATLRNGVNSGASVNTNRTNRDGLDGSLGSAYDNTGMPRVGYYAPDGLGDTPNSLPNGGMYSNTTSGAGTSANRLGSNMGATTNGLSSAATHVGHTLGGVVGGTLGGVEMITSRFAHGFDSSGQTPYFITIENGYVTNIEEVGVYSNFAGTRRTTTDGVTR